MLIFSVLTTIDSDMEFYKAGILPPEVDIHLRVASENGIPVINVGQYLWDYIFKNGADIRDYLTDGVHPNDLGHQLYYESVVQFLTSYFDNNNRILNGEQYNYSGDLANATA
jgi:lysophospholipase L1-like esterase